MTDNVLSLSSVPLHTQLRDVLRARILDGEYPQDSQMPSESELGALFKVSRITVRQALGDLQKEGLIFKIHGKGTFVAKPKTFQNVSSLQGLADPTGLRTLADGVDVRAGLKPDDWVVLAGGHLLHDGAQVQPVDRSNRDEGHKQAAGRRASVPTGGAETPGPGGHHATSRRAASGAVIDWLASVMIS